MRSVTDTLLCIRRHAEQFNGREAETATLLSALSFYIQRAW